MLDLGAMDGNAADAQPSADGHGRLRRTRLARRSAMSGLIYATAELRPAEARE